MLARRDVRILFAAAAWTTFVWVNRVVNILRDDEDRSTGFVVVHVVLAVVSVAFAAAIARIAWNARRGPPRREGGEGARASRRDPVAR